MHARTQQETQRAIIDLAYAWGRLPTTAELGDALGIKRSAAHSRINGLRAAGFLRRDPSGLVALSDDAQLELARFTLGIRA